jgi:Spy/CpxP family protein refolding chaperone
VNYWKVIVATVVIFGAGVFTGGLLVNCIQNSHSKISHGKEAVVAAVHAVSPTNTPGATAPVPRLPDILSKPFLPRIDDLLHLSPEQHKAIEKIISDGQGQMKKVMQDSRMEIRGELTPEQRAKFDELMKRPAKRLPGGTNGAAGLALGSQVKILELERNRELELFKQQNPPTNPPTNAP